MFRGIKLWHCHLPMTTVIPTTKTTFFSWSSFSLSIFLPSRSPQLSPFFSFLLCSPPLFLILLLFPLPLLVPRTHRHSQATQAALRIRPQFICTRASLLPVNITTKTKLWFSLSTYITFTSSPKQLIGHKTFLFKSQNLEDLLNNAIPPSSPFKVQQLCSYSHSPLAEKSLPRLKATGKGVLCMLCSFLCQTKFCVSKAGRTNLKEQVLWVK